MPPIAPGQEFASLGEFKTALQAWAIEDRFQPKILDSDSKRVRVGCRSGPDCPFRIRCNFSDKTGTAKVTTLDGDHRNHIPQGRSQEVRIARPEAGKLKFLVYAVPNLLEITSETPTKDIIDAVARAYGSNIMLRQAQKVKAYLLRKQKQNQNQCRRCGREGHTKRNCPQQQPQQRTGSGPSSETMDATMQSDADGEDISSSDSHVQAPRTQEQHCRICHQAGHNRRNCRQKDSQSNLVSAVPPAPAPAPTPAPALPLNKRPRNGDVQRRLHDAAPITTRTEDTQYSYTAPPDMSDNHIFHSPAGAAMPSDPSSRPPPIIHTNVFAAQEAARLMQEAARLTQEAARLNHQAANLMASVLG